MLKPILDGGGPATGIANCEPVAPALNCTETFDWEVIDTSDTYTLSVLASDDVTLDPGEVFDQPLEFTIPWTTSCVDDMILELRVKIGRQLICVDTGTITKLQETVRYKTAHHPWRFPPTSTG